jgi:hypothetical protein
MTRSDTADESAEETATRTTLAVRWGFIALIVVAASE